VSSKRPRIWINWSKRERDLMVHWDKESSKANPGYIIGLFPKEVQQELDRRGFDITTLKFSIKRKQQEDP